MMATYTAIKNRALALIEGHKFDRTNAQDYEFAKQIISNDPQILRSNYLQAALETVREHFNR